VKVTIDIPGLLVLATIVILLVAAKLW